MGALLASGCSLKYDVRTYEAFAAKLRDRALTLTKAGECGSAKAKPLKAWTAERVGRALWACAISLPVAVSAQALPAATKAQNLKRPAAAPLDSKAAAKRRIA